MSLPDFFLLVCAAYYGQVQKLGCRYERGCNCCGAPLEGSLKINTDVTLFYSEDGARRGGAGVVVLDSNGVVIAAAALQLQGVPNADHPKMLGYPSGAA